MSIEDPTPSPGGPDPGIDPSNMGAESLTSGTEASAATAAAAAAATAQATAGMEEEARRRKAAEGADDEDGTGGDGDEGGGGGDGPDFHKDGDEPETPATGVWPRRLERANWVLLGLTAIATVITAIQYFTEDVDAGHTQRDNWAPVLICLVLFALSLAAALLRPFLLTTKRCVLMSLAATTVFVIGTVTIWQVVNNDKNINTIVGTAVKSDADTKKVLGDFFGPKVLGQLKLIPTGLFIQGAKFTGPQEVEVNGYVWQRYTKDIPETSRAVTFPEAPDGYSMDEVYKVDLPNGQQVRGWHFNLTLRQKFSYGKYPLDKQNIWLRMWTVSAFEPEMIVPDFSSYPPWKYDRLGLDQSIVSEGWSPYYTAYSYQEHEYSMTYGVRPFAGPNVKAPDMYFNIGVARSYAGPMTGKLLQSLFIAAIMFLALFVYTKDDRRNPRFGFSTWTAISFAVSLLLVVVVDQTQIREIVGDTSLSYMEFFAIAQYVVIMGIFANAIILGTETKIRALEWRDNLLPTLLYWPVLIGLFFLFTVIVFAD
ncbi:hypothetical protein H9Y04_34225 [Streptomyces sp. TRM66268-LWL]|uniref:Uncharacterized protein n=1 Tax=Streptomyces polyasparticus TaxID=2767826 RepID=A0ABR7SQ33_9ACTN|nr:hypothetical protein [Streptomyces polyasparticus]MBC9717601.1 hypothetical protein [Streptomyces polyasparticus]